MKNIEKYIYIAIIIILVGVVASLTTYMIMNNNDKPEIKEENKPSESNPNEQITLNEEELQAYLKYVPKTDYYEDYAKFNVYKNPNSIVNMTDNNMINEALNILVNSYESEKEYYEIEEFEDYTFEYRISLNDVNKLIEKMYNKKISEPTNANYNEMLNGRYIGNRAIFNYYNKYFYGNVACAECSDNHIGFIDSYEAKDKDLIIYEYGAMIIDNLGCEMPNSIVDYQNNTTIEIKKSYLDGECTPNHEINGQRLDEYFKSIKNKFTKYKHTFKKDETGYYWYSTEVA